MRDAADARAYTSPLSKHGALTAPTRTLDILILDDDAPTRQMLNVVLGKLGHRVMRAASVHEATKMLQTFVFDLMLCDLMLPDGSGLDVIQHVPPGMKLHKIIISGHSEPSDIARSLAAGFDVHLVKPLDFTLLQRAVWKLTGEPL